MAKNNAEVQIKYNNYQLLWNGEMQSNDNVLVILYKHPQV